MDAPARTSLVAKFDASGQEGAAWRILRGGRCSVPVSSSAAGEEIAILWHDNDERPAASVVGRFVLSILSLTVRESLIIAR